MIIKLPKSLFKKSPVPTNDCKQPAAEVPCPALTFGNAMCWLLNSAQRNLRRFYAV